MTNALNRNEKYALDYVSTWNEKSSAREYKRGEAENEMLHCAETE